MSFLKVVKVTPTLLLRMLLDIGKKRKLNQQNEIQLVLQIKLIRDIENMLCTFSSLGEFLIFTIL